MNQNRKGYIVVIEGTDGSGKQTQAQILKERLTQATGKEVFEISFPNYESQSSGPVKMYLNGSLGDNANDINAYQASAIYAVDRLCTYFAEIKSHIDNDEIIILDRYTPSNALHQAGKIENEKDRDEFLSWLFDFEYNVLGLPVPDDVIFLDVPPQVSQRLRQERRIIKSGEKIDIHEKDETHLIKAYLSGKYVSKRYNWTQISCVDNNNNMLTKEEINNRILSKILLNEKLKQILLKTIHSQEKDILL